MADHPLDRYRFEKITVVDESSGHPREPPVQIQSEVERRRRGGTLGGSHLPLDGQRGRDRFEGQPHLDQPVGVPTDFRHQLMKDGVKGNVFVIAGRIRGRLHPLQQLQHARPTGQIDSQNDVIAAVALRGPPVLRRRVPGRVIPTSRSSSPV